MAEVEPAAVGLDAVAWGVVAEGLGANVAELEHAMAVSEAKARTADVHSWEWRLLVSVDEA